MNMINFLDTSAVLNGAMMLFDNVYISPLVISELEAIKTSDRSDKVKYLARQAVRDILANKEFTSKYIGARNTFKIDRFRRKHKFLTDINDHNIICEATLLNRFEPVTLITSDATMYLFAQQFEELQAFYFEPVDVDDSPNLYRGWNNYHPTSEEMALIYSNPEINVLKAKINEFCKIYEGTELKDVLFWNGERYRPLKYKEFKTVLGEKIAPKNLEQKMYLDLLQNNDIPVKICVSKFGTGKSYLALNYALYEVQTGKFDKIIFVKNNLEVKGAGRLAALPGNETQKMAPWLRQIEDHIGIQKYEEYLECGIIEPAHLSSLRGRDLKNCIILVDEAENLLDTNIQLLLGRVAENAEIIFCADVKQCDYSNPKQSGIPKMLNRLLDNKLVGFVQLQKTERSAVAALADLMD